MKEISIQELQQDASQWVKLAARRERIIITDGGKPIAELTAFEPSPLRKRLQDREERIRNRSLIKVDSADYISEMRG
jgi:prevent-host-death family protein